MDAVRLLSEPSNGSLGTLLKSEGYVSLGKLHIFPFELQLACMQCSVRCQGFAETDPMGHRLRTVLLLNQPTAGRAFGGGGANLSCDSV